MAKLKKKNGILRKVVDLLLIMVFILPGILFKKSLKSKKKRKIRFNDIVLISYVSIERLPRVIRQLIKVAATSTVSFYIVLAVVKILNMAISQAPVHGTRLFAYQIVNNLICRFFVAGVFAITFVSVMFIFLGKYKEYTKADMIKRKRRFAEYHKRFG